MKNSDKAEADRLIGIAEKLLQGNDLNGAKDFAILAQETEPLLESSDQIIAIVDVLLAANNNQQPPPWYAILQVNIDRDSQDTQAIRTQYRRLALLLHPDQNPFPNANHAFTLVSDAWAVLSDPAQKQAYDRTLGAGRNIPGSVQQVKLPVRRGVEPTPAPAPVERGSVNFWTACPYCYVMYEYPRVYEGCSLRCQNCERSFHGVKVPSMPQPVPGKEAYYCSWGFFPMGFVFQSLGSVGKEAPAPAPVENYYWVPPQVTPEPVAVGVSSGVAALRKRGRPRKVV